MDEFRNYQTQPWSGVLKTHERKLPDQISYLASESRFYQDRFDAWDIDPNSIQTLEDLSEVPFTTKDDERRSQSKPDSDSLLGTQQAASTDDLAFTLSSSGTTGTPTYFGLTEKDWDVWKTLVARATRTMGIKPGDTVVDAIRRPMVPGGLPYIMGFSKAGLNVIPAGGSSTEQLLTVIKDLNPTAIHSTPSHFEYLLDQSIEIPQINLSELDVQMLIGGGEPGLGTNALRSKLKRGWGVSEIRDVMGLGDIAGSLAAECQESNGAHFVGHGLVHPELINPETGETRPIEADAEGELVYTPLVREAMPLLRFRSGDFVRILGTECPCGRTSPRIRVIGRTDNMLIYKAQNVYPEAIREVVSTVDGVTHRMKVIRPNEDKVRFTSPIPIKVVRDGTSSHTDQAVSEAIQTRVRNRLGVRVAPQLVSDNNAEISEYKSSLISDGK